MDALEGARWFCGSTVAGSIAHPRQLDLTAGDWWPASVPGTAAAALRSVSEWDWGTEDEWLLDGHDWWFRCRFERPGAPGPWELELGGIATLADVWLNGVHRLYSDNMFTSHRVAVDSLESDNELVIRCAALSPRLAERHRRPRFKSRLVRHQSLRWYRTTLLGRMPGWARWGAPIGPWRSVRLIARPPEGILAVTDLEATCDAKGDGGTVAIALSLVGPAVSPRGAWLEVDGRRSGLELTQTADGLTAEGSVHLSSAERWWPHTHGAQPLYPVHVELEGASRLVRRVGFRTLEVDRSDGGFAVVVNGRRCFCRGVVWGSPDAVSLTPSDADLTRSLRLARQAHINMLRIGGFGTYEDERFWDACDEQGIMVWQDCMLASVDPPDDPAFVASLEAELRQQFGALQGRPALAVACGSSETYQQASMYGLSPERYESDVLEQAIPRILESVIPSVPYVPSSPSGGSPPFRPDTGVAHYFGVGAYRRPLSDARLARVRFAAECLSFATPPERATVERVFGGAAVAGHDPRWKQAVARDAGTSWDFEDVRDHYVRLLFGVDPLEVRYSDPEHALDLGRAAIVEAMSRVLGDWRRPGSRCGGALVLTWQDLWPGAGWGVLDSSGAPKAAYYALARAFAARTVLICDDGLSGLAINVFNDGPDQLQATLRLAVHGDAGAELEGSERPIELDAHQQVSLTATQLLDGFRDLTDAYRFTPLEYDVVVAELSSARGCSLARAHYLPGGPARCREADVGLRAQARPEAAGRWSMTVSSERFAQYVSVDAPGFHASDSWFHLAPHETAELQLDGDAGRPLQGALRSLNSVASARIMVASG